MGADWAKDGKLFYGGDLVVSSERDALSKELEQIELDSKKSNRKWRRADYRYRRDYIERISRLDTLEHKIFFKKFPKLKKYLITEL